MNTKKISFLTIPDTLNQSNNEDNNNSFLTYKEEIPIVYTNNTSSDQSYFINTYDREKGELQGNLEYDKNLFHNSNGDIESENIPNEIYYTRKKKLKQRLKNYFLLKNLKKKERKTIYIHKKENS